MSALASSLAKVSFYTYFGLEQVGPGASRTNAIIGALNALTYVGGFFGSFLLPVCADRWGRRWALAIGCCFVIFGGALQAGSVAVAMLCVARFITGIGVGFLLSGVPIFQAEISPPHSRGLMVGLHGQYIIEYNNLCLGGLTTARYLPWIWFLYRPMGRRRLLSCRRTGDLENSPCHSGRISPRVALRYHTVTRISPLVYVL